VKPELAKRLDNLFREVDKARAKLSLASRKTELEKLESELSQPEIWNNPQNAQDIAKKVSELKSQIEPWEILKTQTKDLRELLEMSDEELLPEFDGQILALENDFAKLREQLLFNGKFDSGDAIIRLSAGAGGDGTEKGRTVRKGKKVGPNDLCPCGSGKKYKNCCGDVRKN